MQNTVRRQLDATVEQEPLVRFEDTESPPLDRDAVEPTGRKTTPRKKKRSRFKTYLDEHSAEIVVGLVVVPVLGWLFVEVVSLKTDVARLEDVKPTEQRIEQRIDKLENHVREDVNRLEERLDRQQPRPPAPSPKTPRR